MASRCTTSGKSPSSSKKRVVRWWGSGTWSSLQGAVQAVQVQEKGSSASGAGEMGQDIQQQSKGFCSAAGGRAQRVRRRTHHLNWPSMS